MTYSFVVDSDDTVSVGVQSLEAVGEGAQHHTALDEVVKLHRILVFAIKHPRTQFTKLHRPNIVTVTYSTCHEQ